MTLEKYHELCHTVRRRCPWLHDFTLVTFVHRHDNFPKWVAGISIILEPGAAPKAIPRTVAMAEEPFNAMVKPMRKVRAIPQNISLANLIRK